MVFKPKTRMLNFRLSEEDYRVLQSACRETGARSVSDYVRDALFTVLRRSGNGGLEARMDELAGQVQSLNRELERLRRGDRDLDPVL